MASQDFVPFVQKKCSEDRCFKTSHYSDILQLSNIVLLHHSGQKKISILSLYPSQCGVKIDIIFHGFDNSDLNSD
jgi:hypothetical protein